MITPEMVARFQSLKQRVARLESLEFQAGGAGGLTLIDSVEASGAQASLSLSGIPGSYGDLIAILSMRTDRSFDRDYVLVRPNGDSNSNNYVSNYSDRYSAANTDAHATDGIQACLGAAANAPADVFGAAMLFVPYYTSGDYKIIYSWGGVAGNIGSPLDSLAAALSAGYWESTAVITSLTFVPDIGANLADGSAIYLYGLGLG